jgi:SPP1 family predicted phage head-tail adaptor
VTQPGELNRRLTLEAPVETADGAGGVTRGFQKLTTLWASVVALSASADIAAASLGTAITHRIVIRAGREVTTRHRLRDGARIFRVVALRESTDRRLLEIQAEERMD